MKVKILKNVSHGGAIRFKDSVHDLPAKDARHLVENEFAAEHKEEAAKQPQQQQQQQQPPPAE